MAITKDERVMFHGNKHLIIGKLAADGTVSEPVWGTGLISMGAMENQSEAEAHYADDIVWVSISGAQLLQGELTFMQLNDDVRTDFFGQTQFNAGSMVGYGDTGRYPERIVQVLSEGIATQADGSQVKAAVLTVYPRMQVISAPTKETETDADSASEINWTASVQAMSSPNYVSATGDASAMIEFTVIGDDAVNALIQDLKDGKFPELTATPEP